MRCTKKVKLWILANFMGLLFLSPKKESKKVPYHTILKKMKIIIYIHHLLAAEGLVPCRSIQWGITIDDNDI